ncbi:MAG: YdcF family protein [Chitinispirillales bacterium]|jgi:uncharacterized SAM-binding protein YcdF (DUF218 family)|nr:YdcF family protein [Chitinispirillales bacterium]
MFVMLSKILAVPLDPIGLTLLLLGSGVVFALIWRKPRMSAACFILGFASFLAFSSPITAYYLMRGLEGCYQPRENYGEASAVVLLGGFTTGRIPPRLHVEVNHAANRAFQAARVRRQGAASKIVLTGGLLDFMNDEKAPEASSMFELMHEHFGIDSADVILEGKSLNTRENAIYTKAALTEAGLGHDIILVTSAFHMPRAVAVFRKAGFSVTPAPCGYFENKVFSRKPLTWLPNAAALFESSIALREYYGIAAYKMAGWI